MIYVKATVHNTDKKGFVIIFSDIQGCLATAETLNEAKIAAKHALEYLLNDMSPEEIIKLIYKKTPEPEIKQQPLFSVFLPLPASVFKSTLFESEREPEEG